MIRIPRRCVTDRAEALGQLIRHFSVLHSDQAARFERLDDGVDRRVGYGDTAEVGFDRAGQRFQRRGPRAGALVQVLDDFVDLGG